MRLIIGQGNRSLRKYLLRNFSANIRIDFGWYSYVGSLCLAKNYKCDHLFIPKHTRNLNGASVQKDFFRDYI